MEIKEIQSLIKFVSKSDVAEVNLKFKDFEIKIKTAIAAKAMNSQVTYANPAPQVIAAPNTGQIPSNPTIEQNPIVKAKDDESKYITVKSPMIGTFYRKPSPDKPLFVEVGNEIKEGSVLCIIEAMKLFNEIESEVSGKIVKVLVDDSSPVEYDQPLFLVDPS